MEGPSLVILREELAPFFGQKVLEVSGNTREPKEELFGRKLTRIETWGKVLFLGFSAPRKPEILTKTHFLMFGSYRIDDPKPERVPRLELRFRSGILYLYACSFKMGDEVEEYYRVLDRRVDVLGPAWNPEYVLSLLAKKRGGLLCDLLLDQTLFAGSGNIVKNEVLFNLRRHPLTKLADVPARDRAKVVEAVREYCGNFYEWKKKFELRRHWQVYRQSRCPLCGEKLVRAKLGKFQRGTFYCPRHQKLGAGKPLRLHAVLPITPHAEREARLEH